MFKADDIVIVYSTTASGTSTKNEFSFCKVVGVGKHDLFCEHIEKLMYSSLFRVSKERCFLLPDCSLTINDGKIVTPKIGDLVLSIVEKTRKERKTITGIVEEITYNPVKYESTTLRVRTGSAVESVKSSSVIILESNS